MGFALCCIFTNNIIWTAFPTEWGPIKTDVTGQIFLLKLLALIPLSGVNCIYYEVVANISKTKVGNVIPVW
jgi:hypothetical protein